jgi:hypothetical protein
MVVANGAALVHEFAGIPRLGIRFQPPQAIHHLDDARQLTDDAAHDALIARMEDRTGKDHDPVTDLGLDVMTLRHPERGGQQFGDFSADLSIRPVKEREDVVAGQDTDKASVFKDREGAHIVADHAADGDSHRLRRTAADDVRRHKFLGGEAPGAGLPVVAVFRHGLVDQCSKMVAADGGVALATDQVCFAYDPHQAIADVHDRDTPNIPLEQNVSDVFHRRCGLNRDRVGGHDVPNQHGQAELPPRALTPTEELAWSCGGLRII